MCLGEGNFLQTNLWSKVNIFLAFKYVELRQFIPVRIVLRPTKSRKTECRIKLNHHITRYFYEDDIVTNNWDQPTINVMLPKDPSWNGKKVCPWRNG